VIKALEVERTRNERLLAENKELDWAYEEALADHTIELERLKEKRDEEIQTLISAMKLKHDANQKLESEVVKLKRVDVKRSETVEILNGEIQTLKSAASLKHDADLKLESDMAVLLRANAKLAEKIKGLEQDKLKDGNKYQRQLQDTVRRTEALEAELLESKDEFAREMDHNAGRIQAVEKQDETWREEIKNLTAAYSLLRREHLTLLELPISSTKLDKLATSLTDKAMDLNHWEWILDICHKESLTNSEPKEFLESIIRRFAQPHRNAQPQMLELANLVGQCYRQVLNCMMASAAFIDLFRRLSHGAGLHEDARRKISRLVDEWTAILEADEPSAPSTD
jgi:hypothetical protein